MRWRPLRWALVHKARTGHGRQVLSGKAATIIGCSFCRQGVQDVLICPCGQVTLRLPIMPSGQVMALGEIA